MYNRVLVPLDGSKLAEATLPHLEEIAKGCHIPEIWLVSVTETLKAKISGHRTLEKTSNVDHGIPPLQMGNMYSSPLFPASSAHLIETPVSLGRMEKSAFTYLTGVSRQLEKKGLMSRLDVLVGNPAEEIIRFAEERKIDLIVMASRGKSGFSRWDMGNIAEKVIRVVGIPVLLVKPEPGFAETKPRRKGVAF